MIDDTGVDEHDWLSDDLSQPTRETKSSLLSKTLVQACHQWTLRDIPSPPTAIAISNDGSRFALCMQRHWCTFTMRGFKPEFQAVQQLPLSSANKSSLPLVRSTSLGGGYVTPIPAVLPLVDVVDTSIHIHTDPYTSSSAVERYIDNTGNLVSANESAAAGDDDGIGGAATVPQQPQYHGGWRGIAFADNQRVVVWSTTTCDIRVYALPDTTTSGSGITIGTPSSTTATTGSSTPVGGNLPSLANVGPLSMRRSQTDSDDITSHVSKSGLTAIGSAPTTSIDAEGIPSSSLSIATGTTPSNALSSWRVEGKHHGRLASRRYDVVRPRLLYRLELDLDRPSIVKFDMKKAPGAALASPRSATTPTPTTSGNGEKKEEKALTPPAGSIVPVIPSDDTINDIGVVNVYVVGDTIYAGTSSGHLTQWLLPRPTSTTVTTATTLAPATSGIGTTGTGSPLKTGSPRGRASLSSMTGSFFTNAPATPHHNTHPTTTITGTSTPPSHSSAGAAAAGAHDDDDHWVSVLPLHG
jgi:hypothetical protein